MPSFNLDARPHLRLQRYVRILSRSSYALTHVISAGGFGNVAAFVLACVRYALKAGAAITLPEIEKRGKDLSALREANFEPFSYMFDEQWFRESLRLSCPQLKVYDHIGSIRNFNRAHVPEVVDASGPESFFVKHRETLTFRQDLLQLLNYTPSFREPAIVRLAPSVFSYPAYSDPVKFYTSFGQILRARQDLVDVGDSVLAKVREKSRALNNGNQDDWIGAHLRTDSDVAKFSNWPKYENVKNEFIEIAEQRSCKLIYIATGDQQHLQQFISDAKARGITVLTKTGLMSAEDREYVSKFSWDQQGLVDYHVLRPAPFLMGSSLSSFTSQLAWSRHLEIKQEKFPWPEDEKSKLIGLKENAFMHGMWPLY